jgi:hypothetical protein
MLFKISAFFCFIFFLSCNDSATYSTPGANDQALTDPDANVQFFPVTSFIKGQVAQIRAAGVNPMKVIIQHGRSDTTWIKTENFDATFREFLTPVIDTANLVNYYTEDRFEDQTIGAFTLMYTSKYPKPDSLNLQSWIVYISPETNKVTKIYILKEANEKVELQLTWDTDKSCKIVTLATGRDGNQFIKKEEIIYWTFD